MDTKGHDSDRSNRSRDDASLNRSNQLTLLNTPGSCFKSAMTCSCPRPRGRVCGTSVLDEGTPEPEGAATADATEGAGWESEGS